MTTPAIILVAYNRPEALNRLLRSISRADYTDLAEIPLTISIDGGGPREVIDIAKEFAWEYGEKKIIVQSENVGLRKHIINCADLSVKYEDIIILEDDCMVSRNYYHFARKALDYYRNDNRIAGIGLCASEYNENAFMPFKPLIDGNSVFFGQFPCSWGQAWTAGQWKRFREFYNKEEAITADDKIPDSVKNWPESSWKKHFMKFMVDYDKYFVYPTISYSTNFSDPGEHWKSDLAFFQVMLEQQHKPSYNFVDFDQSNNKYDAYYEILTECLIRHGADIAPGTCIDMYGTKQNRFIDSEYLLSAKQCSEHIKSYGTDLKPLLQNIICESKGNIFSYAHAKNFQDKVLTEKRNYIWEKQQSQGYYFASKSKYYKLGYYLYHPLVFFKKRIKRYL